MQDGFVKVAAATPEIIVADCMHNAEEIIRLVRMADGDGVKLLVLPELCLTGYTAGDLLLQAPLTDAAMDALRVILEQTSGLDPVFIVGMPVAVNHLLYNCGVVIQGGSVLGIVPKDGLSACCDPQERQLFAIPGSGCSSVRLSGQTVPFGTRLLFTCAEMPLFTFGPAVSEDPRAPLSISAELADQGALILCSLSASAETVTGPAFRRQASAAQSIRTSGCYILASAGSGESTTDLVFSGHNLIYENGKLLSESVPFGPGYAVSEADLGFLSRERRRLSRKVFPEEDVQAVPFHVRIEQTTLTRNISRLPFVPDDPELRRQSCREILAIQAHGLKKRMEHVHPKKLVLGVSGGADSTLSILVCREACRLLGRPVTDICAVTMPCFGTSKRTRGNAEKLCDALGIPLRSIQIARSVTRHLRDLDHPLDRYDVAFENAQARERTQVLMDLANMEGGFVIGTGDLSELALGFATYNGDHMSMYGVNADVPKTAIRAILRDVADREGGALASVLYDIVDTPVSPELLPGKDGAIGQITEELVGPYELSDFFLYHILRRGDSRDKLLRLARYAFAGEYSGEELEKWYSSFIRRFFAQQYKRNCIPDGPKAGSVALSPRGGWHMASDASAKAFQ